MAGEPKGDRYRSYAEICFRLAQSAANEEERARWPDMAQHWVEWADTADDQQTPTDEQESC